MKTLLVKCTCCDGTGQTPLSRTLQQTLDVIPRNRWISSIEISKAVADEWVKPTAINNRLARDLYPLGLIARERRGKALFWKRIK